MRRWYKGRGIIDVWTLIDLIILCQKRNKDFTRVKSFSVTISHSQELKAV